MMRRRDGGPHIRLPGVLTNAEVADEPTIAAGSRNEPQAAVAAPPTAEERVERLERDLAALKQPLGLPQPFLTQNAREAEERMMRGIRARVAAAEEALRRDRRRALANRPKLLKLKAELDALEADIAARERERDDLADRLRVLYGERLRLSNELGSGGWHLIAAEEAAAE